MGGQWTADAVPVACQRARIFRVSYQKPRELSIYPPGTGSNVQLDERGQFFLDKRFFDIESLTAALSFINAIVTAAGVYRKDATMNSLKTLEALWKNRKIYYEKDM
jgi:hypothetical protein